MLPPKSDVLAPVSDPASDLTSVYRDYPGLRALILRRVRDPEVAADILQDAAVTTLEKLRNGEIAHPENVGGYLYRVALNHLRNHRRKDRTAVSSADPLNNLPILEDDPDWARVGRPQWAAAARRVLEEMPVERDREILVRFYLNDEDKEQICRELRLSDEHFNRVIFRARNRFRQLLEKRGFWKADLLTIATVGLCVSSSGSGLFGPAGEGLSRDFLQRRGASLGVNALVDLFAVHGNALRRIDADANLTVLYGEHGDSHVIADSERLTFPPRQNEHDSPLILFWIK